jgi:hypothetical protein
MVAVIVFILGTDLQTGAQNPAMLFAGRGRLRHWNLNVQHGLYQAEIAPPELRGSLVSLQQLSITIGTTIAFWLDYGMHFVRRSDSKPAGVSNGAINLDGTFNATLPHEHTCLGESPDSWRVPLALQLIPA